MDNASANSSNTEGNTIGNTESGNAVGNATMNVVVPATHQDDNDYTNDDDDAKEEQEAETRRLDLKAEMRMNYKKNNDNSFDLFCKFIKGSPPVTSHDDAFCVIPIEYTDGSDEHMMLKQLEKIAIELHNRSISRLEKNKKALEFAAKSGKQINLGDFTPFSATNVVLHTFDNNGVYIYMHDNGVSKNFNAIELEQYIVKKNNITTDFGSSNSTYNGCNYRMLWIGILSCPTKSPMNDRDAFHRDIYSYLIEKGITKRSDDDDDLIFTDDLIL